MFTYLITPITSLQIYKVEKLINELYESGLKSILIGSSSEYGEKVKAVRSCM